MHRFSTSKLTGSSGSTVMRLRTQLVSTTRFNANMNLVSSFHSSSVKLNKDSPPPPNPFKVFFDTFRQEIGKSKDLQENIKALQDETGRMAETESFKKAREAFEKAREGTGVASSATSQTLKKASEVVGGAAVKAWDSGVGKATRSAVNKTADTVSTATEPMRQTKIYKDVKEVIDDGSSLRYGGFEEKEARLRRRQQEEKKRLEEELRTGIKRRPIKANEEAGQDLVVHASAKPTEPGTKEKWEKFKSTTFVGKKIADLRVMYDESENGLIATTRTITDKISNFFAETESAKVIRMFREIDPNFNQEEFLTEVRQYILPEVIDAYVKGDEATLKEWLSEAPYNIWAASTKQYKEAGLFSAGRVLDIRGVDILSAKILPPSDVPVFVIGCRAQEVHLYKNVKTGEIAAGTEDHIQMSTYAMVITRIPEDIDNEETKGWKLLELVRGGTRQWT
ncbi:TIM44 subunit of mitochondria import inner membrane translocase [Nadsonia fulvescens var. elongata DSM 6958]|uniref:Mitochondrial import inner membrane translocase subunit TIM44 n=1 Tax=Nadsonia fulvescens var. elongata DSM 6958 TaxID=857566 RepID=A0A1E3PK99_9ASCO|nr:TIM44 subunit of mitochondria import inner membrane translocase [Nadsonia fulvescens var. elongata DSM 6958]